MVELMIKVKEELIEQIGQNNIERYIREYIEQLDKQMIEKEQSFWNVIDLLDWSKGDDNEGIIKPAIDFLSEQSETDICNFQDVLSEKLFHLDKKVFAQNIGKNSWVAEQPFSSDNFLYARACVVANGKLFYEKILKQPELMPKNYTFEALLDIASTAYEIKTGKVFNHVTPISYETFSNPDGWEQTLYQRLKF